MGMTEDGEVDHGRNSGSTCQNLITKYGAEILISRYLGEWEWVLRLSGQRTDTHSCDPRSSRARLQR
jgi:hypothetical protein